MRTRRVAAGAVLLATAAATVAGFGIAEGDGGGPPAAATPISHLVVIFGENQSFDHYFGTYPRAANPAGDPAFTAAPGTPAASTINNYENPANAGLLTANPNTANPARISRAHALSCDNNHSYGPEQAAFNGGAMDKFVQNTQGGGCTSPSLVMDYYDGNTVTGLWNLAQGFSMSDNFFSTTFGPSTPGAINLISGDTSGATPVNIPGSVIAGTDVGDPDPVGDDCAGGSMRMTHTNIGDQMNARAVTWGWFQGGFRPTSVSGGGTATCGTSHANIGGAAVTDYSAHHEPFQYYASTANPHHLAPSSAAAIGTTDRANHQYDLTDFDTAVQNGNLPQVSFLKAASFEDGHPGYSDPLDEQRFIARTLDELQQSPQWSSTAVVITYDDSDGWYDHQAPTIVNHSNGAADGAICNGGGAAPPDLGSAASRCGYGARLPFLVVSPWVRPNTVDHTRLDQTSILRFIENNWGVSPIPAAEHSFDALAGDMRGMFDFAGATRAPKVYLDPTTGEVLPSPPSGATSAPPAVPAPTPPATPDPAPATPAPAPTPTTTSPPAAPTKRPVVVPASKAKVSISAKRSGSKRVVLTLKVTGLKASAGRITAAIKLTRGRKTVATGKGTVKSGRLVVMLKAKRKLPKGRYVLTATVTQGHSAKKATKKLTLK